MEPGIGKTVHNRGETGALEQNIYTVSKNNGLKLTFTKVQRKSYNNCDKSHKQLRESQKKELCSQPRQPKRESTKKSPGVKREASRAFSGTGDNKENEYEMELKKRDETFTPIQIRDPRLRLALPRARNEVADLPVPRFKRGEAFTPIQIRDPRLRLALPRARNEVADLPVPRFKKLLEDTDELWKIHCERGFKTHCPGEHETWRDLFLRSRDEQEQKLKRLNAKISASTLAKTVRTTKLAYVDSIAKPPRNIARRQAKNGTWLPQKAGPSSKSTPRATAPFTDAMNSFSSSFAPVPPKKARPAPLMQKALKLYGQHSRMKL